MKQFIKPTLLCAGLLPFFAQAQLVDRSKYPDYSTKINPDYSLLTNGSLKSSKVAKAADTDFLPPYHNNAESKHFPPVFNQDGGSCGSASRICYMFTHELNSFRDADAKLLTNRYPSHFVWLLTRSSSGKDEFVQYIGVPNAEVYGGTTYSSLFGIQEDTNSDYGWMQGYDKWYSAMWNRMKRPAHIPMDVKTEQGRKLVKQWLYNHSGDTDFHSGGLAGIGVASSGTWLRIPKTPANDEIGVTGKFYVDAWGKSVDHALTIVGYDDRIEFDLDGNGVKGEKDKDEVGAWIVVNSWSDQWCNKGFVYCPYKHAGPVGKAESGYWQPEIYKVRKNYRPLRTIKIKMDYSHRSEICLGAGVSTNLEATEPEATITFEHFKFAGDGANGNTRPAPAVPMLGRWADGKLHTEPMEFGYDLTDFSAGFDKNQPLKYFFIVETRDWAEGTGKIHNASIINYEFDKLGIETPFNIGEGVQIANQGNKTIISTIVYGESFYAPTNLSLIDKTLSWTAPLRSSHPLKGYRLYHNGVTIADVPAGGAQASFTLTEVQDGTYSIAAIYDNNILSSKISVRTTINLPQVNQVVNFAQSGFSIPSIFNNKFEEATIEYWINPTSIKDWNQSAGPGWGTFMLHANKNGAFTVGWDTHNRINSPSSKLQVGKWTHIAITVKQNVMKLYINGREISSITSKDYSGIGGFGNLIFNPRDPDNNTDAKIDEIRIWNYAKDRVAITKEYRNEFSGDVLPFGLIAYYKGDLLTRNGKSYLREYVNDNHAEILNANFKQQDETALSLKDAQFGRLSIQIKKPVNKVIAGIPTRIEATYRGANKISWSAPDANVENLVMVSPSFTFQHVGEQQVIATASNTAGESVSDTCLILVEEAPAVNADFTPSKTRIAAGERVSFNVNQPIMGYLYSWYMPGANIETANTTNCATQYPQQGEYLVTLTVTDLNGKKSSSTQTISVVEVAPSADFDIAPAVIIKDQATFLKDKSKFHPNKWQWIVSGNGKNIVINGQNSSLTMHEPGVYDISLTAKNGSGSNTYKRNRALIVCNADSKNGLNFNKDDAQIVLSKSPFTERARIATIEWWMRPNSLSSFCCGIGQEDVCILKSTMDGSATLFLGTNNKISTPSGFISANEWHHYAIVMDASIVNFYRDGKLFYKKNTKIPFLNTITKFEIGNQSAPINGQIDEFRIWKSALTAEQIFHYANAPIENVTKAMQDDQLTVYYDFNQNGGNVKDITGNGHEGIRNNFGPDGDAWSLSKGVFSLFVGSNSLGENVTADYLKNYQSAFKNDKSQVINPSNPSRFIALTDWTIENPTVKDDTITTVHVDAQKNFDFTFSSGWDHFDKLSNHKVYQTVTLPAGAYTFIAHYGEYEGNCGDSYLVAANGKTLPDFFDMQESLAAQKMNVKNEKTTSNAVDFIVAEESEVSIGLIINQSGKQCCTIHSFELLRNDVEIRDADNANGFDMTVDGTGYNTLCLPYPTYLPEGMKAFVAKEIIGNKVVLEPVMNDIIPANTGVVVNADAGTYHFEPSVTASSQSSLLYGVLTETNTDSNKRYYSFDNLDVPGFYPYNSSTLEANKAYLVREANDTNEVYFVEYHQTGIDLIETEESKVDEIYDLSGRRVLQPVKGIYITNGKKILVK